MANEPIITITGNIGKNAEHRTSNGGRGFLKFSVAQTPATKQQDGTYLDGETLWFDVTSFDDKLDAIDFLKGTKVKVTGRLTKRVYEGKDYLSVTADELEIVKRDQPKVAVPSTWKQAAAAPAYSDDEMPF